MTDRVYVECAGRTCILGPDHGYVTGYLAEGKHTVGAFVAVPPEYKSDDPVRMLHVTLGMKDDDGWCEVTSTRTITRDEFDRLTTLDKLRHDLGWRA